MVIPGETVISGKYAVLELLGKGGMGQVFKVEHTSFRTQLAIKTLLPLYAEEEALITRFKEEARKNHSLSNPQNPDPNIVQVIDVDFDAALTLHYYIMEYIEGKTLSQIVREQGPLLLPDILTIAEKVGRALAKAHNLPKPLIHRDISPANIMIENRSRRVVVMDFGIAKEIGEEGKTRLDVVIGKPKYCSPEQMLHEPLDGAADIYSLGMVLYELYTGKQFFVGFKDREVIEQVLDPAENTPHFDPPAPKEFVTLVTRSITKARGQRYRRMEEFLQAVDRCRTRLPEDSGETTRTIFMPSPAAKREDTEERRRKLEEELRLLSLDFQGRTRTAREQAEEEGANVLAPEIFQPGQAKEAEANRLLEDRNHSRAQETYKEAIDLFARASAAAQREAERARQEMEAVKVEAERYRARTTPAARRFYTDGLRSEGQAREFLAEQRYQRACEQFAEAQRAFTDARDVAHESLRGEAEAARQQTEAVKDAAKEEGADSLAPELFHQAEEQEHQAAAALEQEEFTQAIQLYTTARRQYGDAQQLAHVERQRQQALSAQQQAQTARQQLEAQAQDHAALPSYGLAVAAQSQGDVQLVEHQYEAAVRAYEQARQGYAQAEQEAREVQKQRAAHAYQHLRELWDQADKIGGRERFAQQWTEADQLVARGAECEERNDFPQAQQWYEHAAVRFEQLRREAEAQAVLEQAETVRRRVAEIEKELESLTPWAGPRWQAAREGKAQAERAWQAQLYEEAAAQYQQVVQQYQEARREAEAERQRHQAVDARQNAQQAQAAAQQAAAPQNAQGLYQQAEAVWHRGEQRFKQQHWEQATAEFVRARELFAEAQEQARQEQRRQVAVVARTAALAARQAAAAGEQLFPSHWREAGARLQQAEHAFGGEQYDTAQTIFTESAASFRQLAQAVREHHQREALKQEAQAMQARASEARQAAITEGAAELAAAAFQRAEQNTQGAEILLLGAEFTAARQGFIAARQQYEEAWYQAQQERHRRAAAREQTAAARQQVAEVKQQLQPLEQWWGAAHQHAQQQETIAEEAWRTEQYEQAIAQYDVVLQAYEKALREAQEAQRAYHAAAEARTQAGQARQAAEAAQALQYTGELFEQADGVYTQATQHLQAKKWQAAAGVFMQARELFTQACQQAEATKAKVRQAAEAARTAARAAQRTAASGEQLFPLLWQEAGARLQQAEQALAAEQYVVAQQLFTESTTRFQQLAQAVQDHQRREESKREAETAKAGAEGVRQEALQDAADRFAPEAFQPAEQRVQQAITALSEEQFTYARDLFDAARRQYEDARGRAQREQRRQAALTAREKAEAAQRQAIASGAPELASQLYHSALTTQQQGNDRFVPDTYEQAEQQYTQARARFVQAQRAAEQERQRRKGAARKQIETLRRQIAEVQAQLQPLAQWWGTSKAQAAEQETVAEETWKKELYEQAAEQYATVLQVYAGALSEAQAARRVHDAAAEARTEAQKTRQAAEAAQAARYAAALFAEQAVPLYAEAEQQFKEKDWDKAALTFARARELFVQARQQATAAEEQARRAAEAARTAVEEVRRAAAEGAPLFPRRWQEVEALREQAEQALAAGQYVAAQEGFTESATRFRQLGQAVQDYKRREELQQAAAAAQARAETAKQQALQDAADKFAADAFAQAEQQFAQAAAALRDDQFTQARSLFDDVCQRYGEAQHQAQVEQRQQAAVAARTQATAAQQQALDGGAAELIPQVYQQAHTAYQRGNEQFAVKAYAQALQEYTQAREDFARALREAEQERQRRAVAAKQRAEANQQQIAELKRKLRPLAQWWGQSKAQAEQQEAVAAQVWGAGQYEQAAERYEQGRHAYEAALQDAQATHRTYLAAAEARAQAAQARQAAETTQATRYAAALFERAEALQTPGEQQFQIKAWQAAAGAFTQARDLFIQAQQQARTAKEHARQAAAAARTTAEEACTQAEQAGAQQRFSQEFAQARHLTAQGQAYEGQQEFAQALTCYQQAAQRFANLTQDAILLAARERAEQERRRATEAKQLPEPLQRWMGKNQKWQEGQRLEAAAERAWQGGEYEQAEQQYQQVVQLYTRARGEAETEQRRHQALETQKQAVQAQTAARDVEAPQYAAALYREAADSLLQGEHHLTTQHWAQAETAFLQAQHSFVQARESAQRTKARQLVAEVRAKALHAQQEAAPGTTLFPQRTAEAAALLSDANRAFAREDFPAAETGFTRSAELFQEIHRAVVLYQQKEQAEQAQVQARGLHNKTLAAKGRQKRRADRALAEGDDFFQQERYSEAQARYEEAASLFTALPPQPKEDAVAVPARSQWFSLPLDSARWKLVGIGSLAVIIGSLYYSGMLRSSLPLPPEHSVQSPTVPHQPQVTPAQPPAEKDNKPRVVPPATVNDTVEGGSKAVAPIAQGESPTSPPGGGTKEEQARTTARVEDAPAERPAAEPKENPSLVAGPQQLAKVTPPPPSPPPLREPPRLTQVTPSPEREILVEEGKSLSFAAEADSPQKEPLRYAWFLDGKKQQEGGKKNWTYKPDFEAAGEKAKEVRVEVTNAAKLTTRQIWSVRVVDVDQPPRIAQFFPPTPEIDVLRGEGLNFSVQATDPDKEDTRLVYIWSLDGKEQSRGESKSWQLPAALADTPHQVKVSVEDRAGKSDQHAWNVIVKRPAPRIVDFRPQEEKIRINAGEPLDFSVTAAVPGEEAKSKLTYQWKINDTAPQRTETGSFRFTETKPGTYQLAAVVIGPEGAQSTEKRWNIEVKPVALNSVSVITKEDAQKWLDMYKQALEGKKAETLARLGAITTKDVERMQSILNGYKNLQVILKDIKIDPNENHATVSFTRVDMDETGRPLEFPPQTIILEKDPAGQVRKK